MKIWSFISQAIGLAIAITIHQYFYALTSVRLGDPIPKKEGRLTLNPLKQIEPIGFVILFLSQFGWGKPVNTNPAYYNDKKKGTIIVALSGIVANLFFAALFGLIFKFAKPFILSRNSIFMIVIAYILRYTVMYCVILAVVNLIPIYPMDGYKILLSVVKPNTYFKLIQYEKIIQMIVILLAFAGFINLVLGPVFSLLYGLFL